MSKFSKRLKKLREERGYTQEQLANILKITRSRLSMYEQGKREPSFELQEAIADVFNVELDYLLGRKDDTDLFIVPLQYDMEKTFYGEEKAALLEFIRVANESQMKKILTMFELILPSLWENSEQDEKDNDK